MNVPRRRAPPRKYVPNFRNKRYEDPMGQIHIQVDSKEVKQHRLPNVKKSESFNNVIHAAMIRLSLKKGLQQFGDGVRMMMLKKRSNIMTWRTSIHDTLTTYHEHKKVLRYHLSYS